MMKQTMIKMTTIIAIVLPVETRAGASSRDFLTFSVVVCDDVVVDDEVDVDELVVELSDVDDDDKDDDEDEVVVVVELLELDVVIELVDEVDTDVEVVEVVDVTVVVVSVKVVVVLVIVVVFFVVVFLGVVFFCVTTMTGLAVVTMRLILQHLVAAGLLPVQHQASPHIHTPQATSPLPQDPGFLRLECDVV